LVLLAATLVAYQPAWHGKRIWDDDGHLTPPELRSINGLARIWTHVGATQQYYPLTFTAFWVQHRLWGDATLGYHLVNILLHCTSALLFLIIVLRLDVPGAYLAAAIFALHPVHVESVAWMTQLKNTLSCVFYLGSALAYLVFDRTRRTRSYALALVLFVMGLMSKTAIVTLPVGLLIVFWWKRGTLSGKRDVLPLVPFFLAGLIAGIVTICLERSLYGARGGDFELAADERCLVAGRAICFHLGKLLWPANLLFMYPRWNLNPEAWGQYLYPAAILLIIAALWGLRHRSRGPLAALLLFSCTLFPTLGFFNVGTFRYSFVNDHHQYLASLGIIAMVSAAATLAARRWPFLCRPLVAASLSLALVAALSILTWRQSRMYGDLQTLWRTTLARNPQCYLAAINLGSAVYDHGQVDEAIAHFRKALEIYPAYPDAHLDLGIALAKKGLLEEAIKQYEEALAVRPRFMEAHINLGNALAQKGRMDEAVVQYQQALEIQPGNGRIYFNLGGALAKMGRVDEAINALEKGLQLLPAFPDAHNSLGSLLVEKGRTDEAIHHFHEALRSQPDLAEARSNLADALARKGDVDGAVAQFSRALDVNSTDPTTHSRLAAVLASRGRTQEALEHYRAALKLLPNSTEVLNNLAWILAATANPRFRNGQEAVLLAEKACKLTEYRRPVMVGTLAAAYAEAGRFPEAVATAEKAAALADQANEGALATRNRQLLELYRAGKPARDQP
jgi:tetratricopeptide (TPR) repeat protein